MSSKIEIQRKLNKNEIQIIEHEAGKSDIWKLFGKIAETDAVVKGFVACKACKKVYMWQPSDGTQTLRKHQCERGNLGQKPKYHDHLNSPQVLTGLPLVSRVQRQLRLRRRYQSLRKKN